LEVEAYGTGLDFKGMILIPSFVRIGEVLQNIKLLKHTQHGNISRLILAYKGKTTG
jgi:hypothetical protein